MIQLFTILKKQTTWVFEVIISAIVRFYWDDCFSRASALAYTSLFALVPVTALAFSFVTGFGLSAEQTHMALVTVISQLLPSGEDPQIIALRDQLIMHLEEFLVNVRAMNIFALGALIFTSVALLNTIESALNIIWRVSSSTSILSKIANFWTVITLGPILIILSIILTAKIEISSEQIVTGSFLQYFLPIFVSTTGLTLLYYKLPSARVTILEALCGGFFAALCFEGIKIGFTSYLSLSSNYTTIYGVVATIPIFLFWLYVAWAIILLGAEITYQAGSHYILVGLKLWKSQLGEIGSVLGLRILMSIGKAFLDGKPSPSESELAIETATDPVLVRSCLDTLTEAKILSLPDEKSHARSLILSPEKLTVMMVLNAFRKDGRFNIFDQGLNKDANYVKSILETLQISDGDILNYNLKEIVAKKL